MRVLEAEMPYKDKHIKVKKYYALVIKTANVFRIKVTTRAIGTPFAD